MKRVVLDIALLAVPFGFTFWNVWRYYNEVGESKVSSLGNALGAATMVTVAVMFFAGARR